MKNIAVLVGLAWLVVACSSVNLIQGDQRYFKSRNGPGVVVPPPLTESNISHFYDLPPQPQDAAVSILPPKV